jgi:hypothetical protein
MKKQFLHTFRTKAHRRLWCVVLCSFGIMVLYSKIGHLQWCIDLAKNVPFVLKCAAFLVAFALLWYVDWRIYQRVLNDTLPKINVIWFWLFGIAAFIFAIVSADERLFFTICTSTMVLFAFAHERFYRRKCDKLNEKNSGKAIHPQ